MSDSNSTMRRKANSLEVDPDNSSYGLDHYFGNVYFTIEILLGKKWLFNWNLLHLFILFLFWDHVATFLLAMAHQCSGRPPVVVGRWHHDPTSQWHRPRPGWLEWSYTFFAKNDVIFVPLFWSACVANTTPPAENPEAPETNNQWQEYSISVVDDEKSLDISS